MKEGTMIIDAQQSLFSFFSRNAGGLVWLNEKLESFSKYKVVKERKKLIPIAFKKDDFKKGYICEKCEISVIEYKK